METWRLSDQISKPHCCLWHPFQACVDPLQPLRSTRQRVLLGFRELVRPVLGENRDKQLGLCAVLSCLQLIGPAFAPVGDNQLVDGEPFGSWHLKPEI